MSISSFEGYTDEEIKRYIAVSCKNLGSDTVARENDGIGTVCDEINAAPLPTVPTIQYLSADNKDNDDWRKSHQELVDASVKGRLTELDCGHYVHKYRSEKIAADMKEFIAELGR